MQFLKQLILLNSLATCSTSYSESLVNQLRKANDAATALKIIATVTDADQKQLFFEEIFFSLSWATLGASEKSQFASYWQGLPESNKRSAAQFMPADASRELSTIKPSALPMD